MFRWNGLISVMISFFFTFALLVTLESYFTRKKDDFMPDFVKTTNRIALYNFSNFIPYFPTFVELFERHYSMVKPQDILFANKFSFLICIPFFFEEARLEKFSVIISALCKTYHFSDLMFIIDTNSNLTLKLERIVQPSLNYGQHIKIVVHDSLDHPHHLAWQHRKHFQENIDKFNW